MEEITIEGARLYFRNFAGAKNMYNAEGDRNFSIRLTSELAEELTRLGWNVKTKPAREGDDEDFHHLKVKIRFGVRPPNVYFITRQGTRKNKLTEAMVGMIDYADLENVDVTVRPWRWTMNDGKTGIAAYLQTMFATLREDPLEIKYQNIQDLGQIEAGESQLAIESGSASEGHDPNEVVYEFDGSAV